MSQVRSNGPVEAINGRLEHRRGIALGFRNLKHYMLRSLIHSGQLAERLHTLNSDEPLCGVKTWGWPTLSVMQDC